MKGGLSSTWVGSLVLMIMLLAATVTAQDGDLAAARELYASAAYEDSLAMLNRLRAKDRTASQSRTIESYRAFCLLALGRAADADQAIEGLVAAEPSYHPNDSEVSPRVRLAFATVRRRMLPQIIQQQYTQAKASFDRKEYGVAADGFSRVLSVLADPDVAAEAKLPPLSDLRTLAIGFAELSAKAAAPPPPPPAPTPPPAPVVETMPANAVANRLSSATVRIYSTGDANVVPPATVNQTLPMFPGSVKMPRVGKLEVVIDETGAVESAIMIGSVSSDYDSRAVAATKTWRYKPATLNGAPVKFRKIVQIAIKAAT
jgi:TonB-like protein